MSGGGSPERVTEVERSGYDEGSTGGGGEFSVATRAESWRRLGREHFDLVVVGGGITGVGIAHDAAGRGLRVALVEAGDFARGTSSRSSRLVHGGLRYLETFHFRLVFEALAERRRLVQLAPHLVRPLPFLYPVYSGADVGMLKLAAGMWLYDGLALFQNIQPHRLLGPGGALGREPRLRPVGLRGAAVYYDAQVDDARLTLAVARAAHRQGAALVPYARVTEFLRMARGTVDGVRVVDALTGAAADARARLVICAAGPWTDELRRLLHPSAPPRLRPTKGVHIQLRRDRVGNRAGIIFRSPVDQRVMFILPWRDFTYVGTTDTDFSGSPDSAVASREDLEYLLASLNAIFPHAKASPGDVISSWAGVRPLVSPNGRANGLTAGQTSREHEIWREPGGPLFVAGGKLTTFRVMAADTVDEAAWILQQEHGVATRTFDTAMLPLPGAPSTDWETFLREVVAQASEVGIPRTIAAELATRHGSDARTVLSLVADERALGEPLIADLPYLWAEVVHAARSEMALTVEDVLRRRLHLFYDAPDGGVKIAGEVARRLTAEAGFNSEEDAIASAIADYAKAVANTRQTFGGKFTP